MREVDDAAPCDWVAGAVAIDAVGHRIVDGGERFRAATHIDADVVAALADGDAEISACGARSPVRRARSLSEARPPQATSVGRSAG